MKTKSKQSMQLTPEQKDKFLTYLEKRGLKKGEGGEIKDMLTYCAYDLAFKLHENLEQQNIKSDLEDLKIKFLIRIVNQGLVFALDDHADTDPEIIQDFEDAQSYEEILFRLSMYIDTFPDFAYKLALYIITNYITTCLKYYFEPDPDIVSFYDFLIKENK